MRLSGLDFLGATTPQTSTDERPSSGVYAAVLIGVLALPLLLMIPLIPGWLRERKITKLFTIEPIEQPAWKSRKLRITKAQLLARYPGEAIESARRVMIARRKTAEEAARVHNVQALELAEIRRFAKNKALAAKRAATIAAKRERRDDEVDMLVTP
jgi:hypothetical protein